MGSSKKHKEKDREGKKKRKHRSKSRSRSRERKRRPREETRTKSPPNYDRERESLEFLQKDTSYSDDRTHGNDYYSQSNSHERGRDRRDQEPREEPQPVQSSGERISLSIEETNRLRAKLGLKPLDVPGAKGDDGKPKKQDAVHAPPINISHQKKTDALRDKMLTKKKQRQREDKLKKIKGLGDSDSGDEGAAAWVSKNRKLQADRDLADKRAKMLEEMDADFGIGELVDQEMKKVGKNYSSLDLGGLKVEHALDKFSEGRDVVLTLKDKGVLDEDEEDVLVNVNIEDDERADKNVENKKKKPDYKPYDEPEFDEYGMLRPNNTLAKYDEEIDGIKKDSFTLGSGGAYDAMHEKRMAEIRQQLRAQGQTLHVPAPTLATEYMTKEEVEAASFKKVKKKVRKIRKKDILKADDILPLADQATDQDYGSRMRGRGRIQAEEEDDLGEDGLKIEENKSVAENPSTVADAVKAENVIKLELDDEDMVGPDEDLSGVNVEEEEVQDELQGMLAKARKMKLKKEMIANKQIIGQIKPDVDHSHHSQFQGQASANIILNSTSEFCRNLGEIPTYGLAGNREEDRADLMDIELLEQQRKQEDTEEMTGGWNEVDIDDNPVDIRGEEASVMEEEPIASEGVASALLLAQKKGYLEFENPKKLPSLSVKALELQAQNYTIQDKRYDDLDEKNRKRERYQGGMIMEFKEKDTYKPEVKLDYVDESGRNLSAKEAFRQLSHRFHGKGSGKKKTEKRSKKVEEELLMKRMSSTDTPLNTLSLLQDKQRSEKSPYIVLSGSKGFTSNTIVKPS